ncbi:MAG: hypothetical protein QXT28_10840 [Thermofilaceae archaeon]
MAMVAAKVEYRRVWAERGEKCVRVRIPREYWERIGSPRVVAVRVAGGRIILYPARWGGGSEAARKELKGAAAAR